MIKIKWGDPAQTYILHDYPNGIAEIDEDEIRARVAFANKQARNWRKSAYEIAGADGGEWKFAYGMEQAAVWQKQADILLSLV